MKMFNGASKIKADFRSKEMKVLSFIKENSGNVTTLDLLKIGGANHTARVSNLRKDGHVIASNMISVNPRIFNYTYLGQKDNEE